MRRRRVLLAIVCAGLVGALAMYGRGWGDRARLTGIHKIRHVVVIMQENRSFDSYFGTYPGADGIPMHDGYAVGVPPDFARSAVCPPVS